MIIKFQISNFKFQKGFTLVELLIVVAIIGVLSTLLTANFIGVRQRSRDAHRKSDLRQIQSGLELYRADEGSYPTSSSFPDCGASLTNTDGSSVYIQKIACDPSGFSYTYSSNDGTIYSIIACLENSNDSEKDATTDSSCTSITNYSYTLKNP